MSVSGRELKKRELKGRMLDTSSGEYSGGYGFEAEGDSRFEGNLKRKIRRRRIIVICIIVAAVLAAAALFLIVRYAPYTTVSMSWEKEISTGSFVEIETFGDNIIKYSLDGVAYYDRKGKELWVDGYEMKSPKAYVNGDYVCISDHGGTDINIYNESSGLTGTAHALLPITKAVISSEGITAAITEDDDASYITFFRRDGTDIDISIKSRLAGDGYPVDIALSPDGSRLIAAFVYIDGGRMRSRTVFYDFSEVGKSVPNRLVGGFEEPFGDSLIASVRFIDDIYSYAAADNGLYFFSSRNISSPELIREEKHTESIVTVFDSPGHVGVILEESEGDRQYRLLLYEPDGTCILDEKIDFRYRHVNCDDSNICFSGDNSCMLMNLEGIVKYEGYVDCSASAIVTGLIPGDFVFTDTSAIRGYSFR